MTNYPSNLSDSQWQFISKYFDTQRTRRYELREIINGILYLVKTGCQWRMLPKDFAPWQLVYYYFNTWKNQEIFEVIQESLVQQTRLKQGKTEQPTVGIIDAQSIKSTLVSSESRGFDAGKRIKGIKRHIIVDTLGMVLAVVIQSASVQDRDGAMDVIAKLFETWNNIIKIFADNGYRGALIDKVKNKFKIAFEVIKRSELHIFKVLPKRWIVERTFAWIDTNRRAAKNYERFNNTSTAIVHLSAIRIMLNRF
ncbi:IS5 family transposase [Mucilaginibacter gossypii]|uniref:IS5 family transposase n=1 Tax=Mucilaginibacter gossypii TaxID=551996 RepID=UPI000DCDD297|nr:MULTISPECIES: IS5 family transposase [Mucilaginibacter]QTE35149.1 IS5 family transposase [Mucilaginibacter gossypii]QTE35277.1 IS5 family transposase [Mucilaginibacter gossypii]QTE35525.1 IS5 family transposase [Mucilaginibacter gossypii]QTE37682.1 IS5 family transposase [Mucilaginibacter gossypii]QTE38930.1 IS5 family transposase [Mucilaginibacter gossypii]